MVTPRSTLTMGERRFDPMANITRYDPFGDMVTLRHAMDRLFDDSFVSPLTSGSR
jgi:hypothetical protein